MAPLPKPPGQTARRNLDSPSWTTLSQDDAPKEVPPFPGARPSVATLAYWTAIWSSPIASMFLDVDHFGLARTCRLHSRAQAGKANGAELAELRQLEQLYGLSPRARRQLQWEVERAAGAGAAHEVTEIDEARRRRRESIKRRME